MHTKKNGPNALKLVVCVEWCNQLLLVLSTVKMLLEAAVQYESVISLGLQCRGKHIILPLRLEQKGWDHELQILIRLSAI